MRQRGIVERNAGIPPENRIEFRVGINLGDVIVEEHDIFGDEVNVAARLEALAEPGGILRPFARSQIGFIGDALNLSTRLTGEAEPGEIVVSNAFYQALDEDLQSEFIENRPIVAKNIGTLRSWRRLAAR